jgi:hypothetical protein
MSLSSPGVEVNLQDFSDYTSSPSTCVAGIIGTGTKGPVSALVTTVDQFIRTFGKPNGKAYGPYAAIEFLKQGNQLYYHRVVKKGTRAVAGNEGTDKLLFTAVDEGESSNDLEIVVTNKSEDSTVSIVINKKSVKQEEYSALSTNADSVDYIPKRINGTSKFITVQVQPTGSITDKTYTLAGGTNGATKATSTPVGEHANAPVFTSKTVDITVNDAVITITEPDSLGYGDYTLTSSNGTSLERFAGVNLTDVNDTRYLPLVLERYSEYVEMTVSTETKTLSGKYTMAGAYDGASELEPSDYISSGGPIEAFSNPNTFPIDVLAIPGVTDAGVIHTAVALCEQRKDVMFITDVPYGMSVEERKNWANASGSWSGRHAAFDSYQQAIYGPWVNISDTYNNGKLLAVPPSVVVLPRWAYSDKTGGIGLAPAGIDRGRLANVVSLEYQLSQGDCDAWYGGRNVINPIVNFGTNGIVINGQKTTQRKATALDRINVVRVINYVRKQVLQLSQNFLFESNHPVTYTRWVGVIEPMLDALVNSRTITAYQVQMDETTVTDYDRDNSRLPGRIAIQPTKLIEFVEIDLRVDNQSVTYIEE